MVNRLWTNGYMFFYVDMVKGALSDMDLVQVLDYFWTNMDLVQVLDYIWTNLDKVPASCMMFWSC